MKDSTRKVTSVILVVLIAYFLLGLVGVLPAQYDITRGIKTSVSTGTKYEDHIYISNIQQPITPYDVDIDHVNQKIWVMSSSGSRIEVYNYDMTFQHEIAFDVPQPSYCGCMVIDDNEGKAFCHVYNGDVISRLYKIDTNSYTIEGYSDIRVIMGFINQFQDIDYAHMFNTKTQQNVNYVILSGSGSVLNSIWAVIPYDLSFLSWTNVWDYSISLDISVFNRDIVTEEKDAYATMWSNTGNTGGAIIQLSINGGGGIGYHKIYGIEGIYPYDIKITNDDLKILFSGIEISTAEWKIYQTDVDLSSYNTIYSGQYISYIPFIETGKSINDNDYYYWSERIGQRGNGVWNLCYYDGFETKKFYVGTESYPAQCCDMIYDESNGTIYYTIQNFNAIGILYPTEEIITPTTTEMNNITITVTQAGDNGKATVDTLIPIEAQIECNDTIDTVRVLYKGVNSENWQSVDMALTSGDGNLGLWSGNIPAQDGVGTVTCQVYAKSSTGNEAITSFFDIYVEEQQPAPTPSPAITIDPSLFYGIGLVLLTAVGIVINRPQVGQWKKSK